MIRSEFDDLMQLSVAAGNLKRPVPYEMYVNDTFAQNARPATLSL
jgi:NitT/TauT family transport system substrate-binding protein